jgi:hypothetical protein
VDGLRPRAAAADRADPLGGHGDPTAWNGKLEGAVHSGEQAAWRMLQALAEPAASQ